MERIADIVETVVWTLVGVAAVANFLWTIGYILWLALC